MPRDAVSQTANFGTVGKNGLRGRRRKRRREVEERRLTVDETSGRIEF